MSECRELPEQDHITAIEPDANLAAQNTSVTNLERDTLSKATRDTANRHSAEDRDVQDDGQADAQVHRVVRDDDLVKSDVSDKWMVHTWEESVHREDRC